MFNLFKSKIIFISDYDANIGNLSEKLFYVLHKAKRENKKIIFIKKKLFFGFLFKKLHYKQLSGLYRLQSKYIDKPSFLSFILSTTYGLAFSMHVAYRAFLYVTKIRRPFSYKLFGIGISNLINVFDKKEFDLASVEKIDWSSLYQEDLDFSLSDKDNEYCSNNMAKMGITKDDWYVCLHIRTSFYHGDTELTEFRNSLPENYRQAINYINDLGGKVVRLGDPVPMSINELCIDYPNSEFKSELMDLYLIKNCKFYIGTNSGILDTALLLGKPILAVNYANFCLSKLFKSHDKILYKSVSVKNSPTKLSLKEVFNQPFYVSPDINEFYMHKFHENYSIHENTPEEIFLAVQEMIEDLKDPKNISDNDKEYNRLLRNAISKWINEEKEYIDQNIEQAYRYYQRTYGHGRVCRFYLDREFN